MKKENVIRMLADILDVDIEEVKTESLLDDYEDWDSLAKLTLMAEVKKMCNYRLTQENVKTFKKVSDICCFLEGK